MAEKVMQSWQNWSSEQGNYAMRIYFALVEMYVNPTHVYLALTHPADSLEHSFLVVQTPPSGPHPSSGNGDLHW